MKIIYSPRFFKEYKKLPLKIKSLAEKKEELFRNNLNHPSLKTHKLIGKLNDFYTFSINYQYRIVFHYENKTTIAFDNIGTHRIYK